MATRNTLIDPIAPEQDTFVRNRLKSGRSSSASEVIRAALRSLERDETGESKTQPQASKV